MGRKPIREQRRKEILEALYRCLLRKPYRETSIKDIGAEAGINFAMLHYYFRSKEDILLHFIDSVYENYRAMFSGQVEKLKDSGISHREFVRRVFDFMNTQITTDKDLQTIFVEIWEIALYNPAVNARVKKIYTDWIRELGVIMHAGGESPRDTDRLAMALVAFQEGMGLFSVFFGLKRKDTMDIMEEFQEMVIEKL